MGVIKQITDEIEKVEGIKLLDVDPGKATNRTVVTFVGAPEAVTEAAFRAVSAAARLIDMSKHRGEHPRFGATDVCPLVPVSGISMEEVVVHARQLAERIGKEINIPVFCYENAAFRKERKNLADVRAGEYEGLPAKLKDPEWKPDYGPDEFVKKTGAIAVGARDFLVAYNINLNTTSARRANAIAYDIREKGRIKRRGNPFTGEIVRDKNGNPVMIPGSLKAVKAIGWFIEEYGIAQISMNLTSLNVTPIHAAFDETCEKAVERGIRVTGSELVGMVPLEAMLDAGRYFLKKQQRSAGVSDRELIKIAVKSLGLNDLHEFRPEEKIIEYRISEKSDKLLKDKSVEEFVFSTASESPAPGGGSVSACIGALGAALGTMVANLSAHKRGWDDHWEEFSDWAVKGKKCQEELISLIDQDTAAFNAVLDAYSLPDSTEKEKFIRSERISNALKDAITVPFRVMEVATEAMEVVRAMAENGNPNSITDAGVGALALKTCVNGAFLNVKINVPSLKDSSFTTDIINKGTLLQEKAEKAEKEILALVEGRL